LLKYNSMAIHLEKKDIIFFIVVPLFVAVISVSPALFGNGDKKSQALVNQKIDSGSGIAEKNIVQKGNGNAVAGHDAIVNNNYGDSTPGKGDTYIVNSKDQKGGITAGKVLIYKNITVVKSDDAVGKKVKDNYLVSLDTASQIIYLQPKVGKWLNPFIGFPKKEDANVQPHFSNQGQNILKAEETIFFNGDSLYCMFAKMNPATKDLYYLMHYKNLPKYMIFGSYPSTLYKATFR